MPYFSEIVNPYLALGNASGFFTSVFIFLAQSFAGLFHQPDAKGGGETQKSGCQCQLFFLLHEKDLPFIQYT